MKKLLLIFLLSLLGGLSASAATTFVRMTRFNTFDPKDISINVGDTVTWTNTASIFHDAVAFDETFRSPLFGIRQTYSFTFTRPGQFDYYCTPHLGIGMVGSVTVVGAANTAPTATITAPANNAAFDSGQPIEVTVNATDDTAVTKVDLLVDGAIVQTDTLAPYQFTLNLSTGPHTLFARATDQPGLTGDSPTVNVSVRGPNQPPTVAVTFPAPGAEFTAPASFALTADATDDSTVIRVEFLVDEVVIGSDETSPYSFSATFAAGQFRIAARAVDNAGVSATSAPVLIQVNDPLPTDPTVTILAPAQDAYVGTNATLRAEAIDLDGLMARLEFREGTNVLGSITRNDTNRLVLELTLPLTEGRHTITASGTDNANITIVSDPVSFTVTLQPTFTSSERLTNGVTRLSVFGTTAVPFVFEHSEDMTTWTPFLTNALVRRILFFDDLTSEGRPNRIYRARSPIAP